MIVTAGSPFVGRHEALDVLMHAYDAAASGAPGAVLISGEAGVGKTRLLAQFLADVRDASLVVVSHCLELAGAEMPLAPAHELVHRAYRMLGAAPLIEAAGPYRAEIAALEPALGSVGAAVDQPRLFSAVRHVLESLGEASTVVMVIEDLHWADGATLSLLRFLAATMDDAKLVILGTERTGGRRDGALTEIQRLPRVSTLQLGPLSQDEAVTLANVLADKQPGHTIDAASIAHRSGGNPLYVEELVAAGSELALPLRELLRAHLDGLSASARDLVELISIGDQPIRYDDLAVASGRPADDVDAAIAEAHHRQLLSTSDPGRLSLRHALLGEATRADLDPGRWRALHRAWADCIQERSPTLHPHAALALAHHRAEAGDPAAAIQAALDGAKAAETLDLHDVRTMLLTRVLDLKAAATADTLDIDEAEILRQAAKSSDLAGLPGSADLLDRAITIVDPDNVDLLVDVLVARAAVEGGNDRPEMPALERALHVLPSTGHDRARGRVLAEWADYLVTDLRTHEAVSKAEEALRLARASGDVATEAQALKCLAAGLMVEDPQRSIELHHQAIDAADRARTYGVMVTIMSNAHSVRAEVLGQYETSIREGEAFLRQARRRHVEHKTARLHTWSAASAYALGRLDEMEEHLRRADRLPPDHDSGLFIPMLRVMSDLVRGDDSSARAFVANAQSAHHFQWTTPLTWLRSWLTYLDDGPDAAAAVLLPDVQHRAEPGWANYTLTEPEVLLSLAMYVRRGRAARDDSARAVSVLASVRDTAMGKLPDSPLAAVLHASLSEFDGVDATTRWRNAATAFREAEGPVYWRINTLIEFAEVAQDRAEALDALDHAERDALAMGSRAQLDEIAVARHVLSDRPAPAGLTRREVEILRLVDRGLTNSQIGELLFISPNTVGVHISHILTKTGTTSRLEAASWAREKHLVFG